MGLNSRQKAIARKVHAYVRKVCHGFAEDDVFKNHILGVRDFSIQLAREYRANLFVVTLSAYLHDIHYIQTKNHDIHEIEGSKFAREYLKQYGLSERETAHIASCILYHRGSKESPRRTIEEKIIASADAMDHISRFQEMFYRVSKERDYKEAVKWMSEKIKRGWNKIELKKGREIVKEKYLAAKIAFS